MSLLWQTNFPICRTLKDFWFWFWKCFLISWSICAWQRWYWMHTKQDGISVHRLTPQSQSHCLNRWRSTKCPYSIPAVHGGPIRDECCISYLDDMLHHAKTCDEHVKVLCKVLRGPQHHGVKLRPEKCKLIRQEVRYVGGLVSVQGVKIDPRDLEALQNLTSKPCLPVSSFSCFTGLIYSCVWVLQPRTSYSCILPAKEETEGRNPLKQTTNKRAYSENVQSITNEECKGLLMSVGRRLDAVIAKQSIFNWILSIIYCNLC